MKLKRILRLAVFVVAFAVVTGCGSTSPSSAGSSSINTGGSSRISADGDELDRTIRETSDYLNRRIPKGTKVVFLNVQSDWPDLSEYILSILTENAVNDDVFTVVDRQQLDAIRSEQNFQLSGEVDDASAQKIGKLLGAQSIISGSITAVGSIYRIQIRAIAVQTAAVQGQFSQNVDDKEPIVTSLTKKVVPAGSGTSATATATAQKTTPAVPVQTVSQNQVQQDTPQPQPNISTDRAGLYVNGVFQEQMDLLDSIDWIKLNARSGGNYDIVLGNDEAVPYILLNFNNLQLSITVKASGIERRVYYDNNRPSYSMFTVGTGVTFILEDGIILSGLQSNSQPLVRIEGGNFIMNGGSIKDNYHTSDGGGVYINSGAFTMNNGMISGNSVSGTGAMSRRGNGGGVYMYQGTFIMNNGTISGNSSGRGGGVYVGGGTFTMMGGTISGNTSFGSNHGGGVYIYYGGTFTKSGSGGIIYGSNALDEQANKVSSTMTNPSGHAVYVDMINTSFWRSSTARVSQALDSRQKGAAGGWE